MNRIPSIALLIVGVILIGWGVKTHDSFSSGFSEFFTGSPSAKAIWLIVLGVLLGVAGLFGTLRGGKS